MAATTRAGLRYPALTDTPDVVRDIQNLATDADGTLVMYSEGLFSARPAAGKHGRLFYATDTVTLYYDFGSGWLNITPSLALAANSVTATELADNAVDTAALQAGAVTSAKIADGTITAADIAAALFPSQGAGAAVEALRALGTGAGQAAAGNSPMLEAPFFGRSGGASGNPVNTSINIVAVGAAGTYLVRWGGSPFHSAQGSSATITLIGATSLDTISGGIQVAQTKALSVALAANQILAINVTAFTASGLGGGGTDLWVEAKRVA